MATERTRLLVDAGLSYRDTCNRMASIGEDPARIIDEIERGIRIEDFTMLNVPARVARLGDLWKPLLEKRGRFNLGKMFSS